MIHKHIDPVTGTPFVLSSIDFYDLIPFLHSQSFFHIAEGTQDGNNCYLNYNTDLITSVDCFALYDGETIIAYAMVLKQRPKHLARLYTSPGYRQMGLGAMIVETLGIVSLGCLRTNNRGLELYKRLGFVSNDNDSVVQTLTRSLS